MICPFFDTIHVRKFTIDFELQGCPMAKEVRISDATIERVAYYLRPLEDLKEKNVKVVSSEQLADICKVNPAQVRKDLSFFGEFGVRGVGYSVKDLLVQIQRILASDREWRLAIVGLDDMGMALVEHKNFLKRGYRFVAAFDYSPDKAGTKLPSGLIVHSIKEIQDLVHELNIEIGVLTTPPTKAQEVADMFFEAGIMAIVNFSTIQLRTPECCLVKNVDLTLNLDHLAYQLSKKGESK